ncbi:TonB-dependent receptor [Aurantiacibacter xanthus]|uniref:TonB-dependent receptor n=1 Tax=Aurantiacibacter xanthus TaxID=1784712 RepID=A0A3A1P9T4_9SPHN|nr:TonB-dependent receptor [Aurantiacibacter xanthus]RIV90318.1 TonB-dependent receptor [Aurantiacibacter xanthus]
MRFLLLASACSILAAPCYAKAEERDETAGSAFDLGRIVVRATIARDSVAPGSETLGQAAIEAFNRTTLDDALTLVPGIAVSASGDARNERLVTVRGFDRFQVPISIDGIRVYLPYDNRLDYGRFLSGDLAEVQVAKGYASVLDGPGAMGGAINLVTRRPTRALEAHGRATLDLDRDGDYAGYTGFAALGTRQERWYAQASFARSFRDHWDLPDSFTPTAVEDGGARELSRTEDWRLNAKLGYTPNETDEYVLSYTRQEGSKNAPPHVTDPGPRAWAWPEWDIDSFYALSTTQLSDGLTLKMQAYLNSFNNLLRGFDDATQTSQTLPAGRVFNSWYADQSHGGAARLEWREGANRLGLAFHYRRDEHIEYSQLFPTGYIEPEQRSLEDTFSLALEDELALADTVSLTVGVSYDWRTLIQADEFVLNSSRDGGTSLSYPLRNADAWNGQARLDWQASSATSAHLSLSSRTRFPTLAERFSSRFGGATSNPALEAERATTLELGATQEVGGLQLEAALFHSWIDDAIVAFPFIYNGTGVSQSRNVGSGTSYGAELSASAVVSPTLQLGANYTYIHRDFTDPSIPAFEPTGVPGHRAFAWASWQPAARLSVLPSLELASDRWTVNSAGTRYYQTGGYALADLRVDYEVAGGVTIGAAVRNLFDELYMLTDGFPEAGRRFSLIAKFDF